MSSAEQNVPDNNRIEAPPRARVLLADDDPAIRLVLRHRLEADNYAVEEAADSAAALEALRSGRFDVALVDIIMPGVGGLEVLSTARAENLRALIFVITAASTMNNAVEAMKEGAYDYLTKPFANLDLVAASVGRAVEVASQAADLDRVKNVVNRQLVGGEIIGAARDAGSVQADRPRGYQRRHRPLLGEWDRQGLGRGFISNHLDGALRSWP